MKQIAIRASGLTRQFSSVRALNDLTIEVPAGVVFGFLGPNGSGKTTTIRLLLNLIEPTGGSAEVRGFDTRTTRPRNPLRCGALLEHSGLYDETIGSIERRKMIAPTRRVQLNQSLLRVCGCSSPGIRTVFRVRSGSVGGCLLQQPPRNENDYLVKLFSNASNRVLSKLFSAWSSLLRFSKAWTAIMRIPAISPELIVVGVPIVPTSS